jgi:hypothetical protein
MRDLSRKHILAFTLFFIAFFAVLFAGVVRIHNRKMQQHATAHYALAASTATPTNQ